MATVDSLASRIGRIIGEVSFYVEKAADERAQRILSNQLKQIEQQLGSAAALKALTETGDDNFPFYQG